MVQTPRPILPTESRTTSPGHIWSRILLTSHSSCLVAFLCLVARFSHLVVGMGIDSASLISASGRRRRRPSVPMSALASALVDGRVGTDAKYSLRTCLSRDILHDTMNRRAKRSSSSCFKPDLLSRSVTSASDGNLLSKELKRFSNIARYVWSSWSASTSRLPEVEELQADDEHVRVRVCM